MRSVHHSHLVGFAVVLIGLAATAALVLRAQTPDAAPEHRAQSNDYNEAALTEQALAHASALGIAGETRSAETYLITLGQWHALNGTRTMPTPGTTSESAVFIVKGYGQYVVNSPVAPPEYGHDRIIVAVYADTGAFLAIKSYPSGVPALKIDADIVAPDGIFLPAQNALED